MQLFFATAELELIFDEQVHGPNARAYRVGLACQPRAASTQARVVRIAPQRSGRVSDDTVYLAVTAEFFLRLASAARRAGHPKCIKLLRDASARELLKRPTMPRRLEAWDASRTSIEDQLAQRVAAGPARVAILNQYATAFGDTIVSLTAFRELRRRLAARFGSVEIGLVQHPDNLAAEELIQSSGVVDRIHRLPAPLAILQMYDGFITLPHDPDGRQGCWIDGMLDALGIDADTVTADQKRNELRVDSSSRSYVDDLLALGRRSKRPLILVHAEASAPIRSVPPHAMKRLLERLLAETDAVAVTTAPAPFSDTRIVDVTGQLPTFSHFVALVSAVDGFISADTCLYHVADALDVPGVVLFTSVEPERRLKYYEGIHGLLMGDDSGRLLGRHDSTDADHLAIADAAWARFDPKAVIGHLGELRQGATAPR